MHWNHKTMPTKRSWAGTATAQDEPGKITSEEYQGPPAMKGQKKKRMTGLNLIPGGTRGLNLIPPKKESREKDRQA